MSTDDNNTSTNEETPDTDVALEDIEVTLDEIDGSDTEEVKDDKDEIKDTEPDVESKEDEPDTVNETEEDETEEGTKSDDNSQKAFNKEMASKRIRERQEREKSQKDDQQEYVAESEDDNQLVIRQLQVDAYNNKVEGNTNKLINGYEKAIKDFEILNSDSPAIKTEIDAALDAFQAQYVTVDSYGNPTEIRANLYDYLQNKADSISRLTGIKVKNQEINKDKEKSKTFTPPSKAPKEPKKDLELDAFDEEAAKW